MSEREIRDKKGRELIHTLFGVAPESLPFPAEFARYSIEHLFGDVWQAEGLTLQQKSLTTCTVLVALVRENEQRVHFRGARNLGIARETLEAMITHVAHYAGWPAGATAFKVLNEVWTAMDAESA